MDGSEDTDRNGAVDNHETDPLDNDSDDDMLQDGTESGLDTPEGDHTDPSLFVPDTDTETTTDPTVADTDAGSIMDGAEDINHNGAVDDNECDPNDGDDDHECIDTDGDGLTDALEIRLGTDPHDADTDDDGLTDAEEAGGPTTKATDPNRFEPDTDPTTTTDPNDDDTDNDGLLDGSEDTDHNGAVDTGETDPLDDDSDHDGVQDGTESGLTEPQGHDTDANVQRVDADPHSTTDPLDHDSDDDDLTDGEEDANQDGNTDDDETDPNLWDTDHGSFPDGVEVERGTNPLDPTDDASRYAMGGQCSQGPPPAYAWLLMPLALLIRRRKEHV
jgi:hypothetical protein